MNHKKISLIVIFIGVLLTASGFQTSPEFKILFEKAKFTMETKGDLNGAINLFSDIIKKYPKEREYGAKSQLYIGLCYEKLGVKEAQKAYQKVVSSYPEQTETVKLANEKLSILQRTKGIATNNEMTIRRVWANPGTSGEGGPSSDGHYLSFTDWETGDLAIHDLITGENRRLTNKGSWTESTESAGHSLFSPNGRQIVYSWLIWEKNQTELRIINIDGSQPRVVFRGDDSWPVSWSADGKFILVKLLNKDRTWRPAIITIADSSVQELAIQKPGTMCFSPDGGYIAYDAPQDKDELQRDVYLYDLGTKRIITLVKHQADDNLLGWSPDGSNLLFTSNRGGTRDAWLLGISGGQPQGEPGLIRKNIGDVTGVGFSQTGAYYFQLSVEGHNIYTAKLDFDNGTLLLPPLEATGSFLGSNWRPDFSNDGKLMAYISKRGSGTEQEGVIAIRSLEIGSEKLLKPSLDLGFALRWFPDGRSLLVNGTDNSKKEGLFRVDIQTGKASLIKERHFVGVPGLKIAPDGNKIFYSAVTGAGIPEGANAYDVRHFVLDLKTGQELELARPRNTPLVPLALSPDGEQLAFIGTGNNTGSAGICIIPSKGGPQSLVADIGSPGWASRVIDWTPDGRYLIYAVILPRTHDTNLGQTSWELWRVSSKGGEPQRIGLTIDGLLRHISIHPDGERIVYYAWRGSTEIWAMENFLPKGKIVASNQFALRKLEYDVLNTPFARLSPDGKKIAYAVYSKGSPKGIDILDLASGTSKVLVESVTGGQSSLVWSPQSDKIAYTFRGKELNIRDIGGANSSVLLKDSGNVIYPTDWSGDGKKIVCFFEGADMKVKIGIVTIGGQKKFIASGNSTEFRSEPKISPDGRYIACSLGEKAGNSDIYMWTADGSSKIQVTNHTGRDENPVWSPDGKYLLFLSDQNRSVDLWGLQIKEGKAVGTPFIIKQDIGWRSQINDFTANGKLFLLMLGGAEPGNLFSIPVDQVKGSLSGTIDPISVFPTDHYFPRFSPDGKMIAYISRRGQIGWPKLFILDEKGAERELPLQGHYVVNLSWHPENGSVIFAGWDKDFNAGIFEILLGKNEIKSVYSGEKVDLKAQKGGLGNINLLPDIGKMMFFRSMGKGYHDVITCDPDGQNPAVVLSQISMRFWGLPSPTGENICCHTGDSLMIVSVLKGVSRYIGSYTPTLEANWSPHGESLMFREGSALRIYSLKENAWRTLYQAPAGNTIGGMEIYAPAWSPDGSRFIFTERDTSSTSTSPQKLLLINPGDGSFKTIGETPQGYNMSELRWSPDGSKVVATAKSSSSQRAPGYEYWVLENFLPK